MAWKRAAPAWGWWVRWAKGEGRAEEGWRGLSQRTGGEREAGRVRAKAGRRPMGGDGKEGAQRDGMAAGKSLSVGDETSRIQGRD